MTLDIWLNEKKQLNATKNGLKLRKKVTIFNEL